jgi:dephospho-CoA kinase
MRVIGLTGGIASGKSTVSAMFRALGAEVIDADQVARQVVEPGTAVVEEISRRFPGVVDAQGRLDRAALAARIFSDPAERSALEAIVHPRIQAEVRRRIGRLEEAGVPVVLYDAALLVENGRGQRDDRPGLQRDLQGVVLVWAPEDVQRRRLAARDGLGPAEVEARLRAQMPLAAKRVHATWEVDNGGSLAATEAQVRRIWEEIRRGSG